MRKTLTLIGVFGLLISSMLFATKISTASTGPLTGSCGMILNVSHWGVPVLYGQQDGRSNNFLMLINFDSGTISGYATNVTFGQTSTSLPSYSTSSGGIAFSQSADAVSGFFRLVPAELDRFPELKVLPVNGRNTYLIIAGGNERDGAGGSGVCQQL